MKTDDDEDVTLDPEPLEAFGRELDALLDRTRRDRGARDAAYIRRTIRLQRGLEVAGRALLFGGAVPALWGLGTGCLAAAKIVENMEIGHNVMHGQYDFMNDPALASDRYEWDIVCPADQWRHGHNYLHHTFTSVRGVDHDLGYRILRIEPEQRWSPWTLLQPVYAAALALFFEYGVATHDLDLPRYVTRPEERTDEDRAKVRGIARKIGRQALKDYVLFPLLAGPAAAYVLAGNVVANIVRNVWAFSVIFCGHFPDGTRTFPPSSLEGETRGAFYLRQIMGSANFEGGRLLHFLSGHLSHQIEHHLFPDIPAHRYPEMAREVRAICHRYGVPYNTGTLGGQLLTVARKILRLSLPSRDDGSRVGCAV